MVITGRRLLCGRPHHRKGVENVWQYTPRSYHTATSQSPTTLRKWSADVICCDGQSTVIREVDTCRDGPTRLFHEMFIICLVLVILFMLDNARATLAHSPQTVVKAAG